MAKYYGTTPSRLLRETLGDFALDLEAFDADMEQTAIEQEKLKAQAAARGSFRRGGRR